MISIPLYPGSRTTGVCSTCKCMCLSFYNIYCIVVTSWWDCDCTSTTGTEIKMMSPSIFWYVSIIMDFQNIMLVDIYILALVLANKLSCYLWKVSKIPRVNQKKKIKYTHRFTQVSITSNARINMTSSLPYDRLQIGSWNIVVT